MSIYKHRYIITNTSDKIYRPTIYDTLENRYVDGDDNDLKHTICMLMNVDFFKYTNEIYLYTEDQVMECPQCHTMNYHLTPTGDWCCACC